MKKTLIGLIMVIVIAGVVWGGSIYLKKESLNYVTIDINPSVQLGLNNDGEILEVITLNEDADILVNGLELVGTTLDEGVELIVGSAVEIGYIDEFGDENDIVVTSYSENEPIRTDLEEKILSKLKSKLEKRNIYASVLPKRITEAMKEEADEYGISYGKMLLIERAHALNSELNKAELAEGSIRTIQKEFKEVVRERQNEITEDANQLRTLFEQQKEAKLEAKNNRIKEIKEEIIEQNQNTFSDVDQSERDEVIKQLLEDRKKAIREAAEKNRVPNSSSNAR